MAGYWADHAARVPGQLRAKSSDVDMKASTADGRPIYRARRTPGPSGTHNNITVGEVLGPTCIPISFSGFLAPCIYAQEKFDQSDYIQMLKELFDVRCFWLKLCLLEVLSLFMSTHCASRTLKAAIELGGRDADGIVEGTQLGTTQKVYWRQGMVSAATTPEEARALLWFRDENSRALLGWVFKWTDVAVSRAYWVATGIAAGDATMITSLARLRRKHAAFVAAPRSLPLDEWYAKIAKYTRHLQRGATVHYDASVAALAELAATWSHAASPRAPREATIFNGAAGLVAQLYSTPDEPLPLHELKGIVARAWPALRPAFPHVHAASQLPPHGPTEKEVNKRRAKGASKDTEARYDGPDYLFNRGGQGVDALLFNIGVQYADDTGTIVQVSGMWWFCWLRARPS